MATAAEITSKVGKVDHQQDPCVATSVSLPVETFSQLCAGVPVMLAIACLDFTYTDIR